MPSENTLQLVIQADAGTANKNVDKFNRGLSDIEKTATQSANTATRGIDSITASMAKGVAIGSLFADVLRDGLNWLKEWTIEAAKYAAHGERMEATLGAIAAANGYSKQAATEAIAQIKQVGFTTHEATEAVDQLLVSNVELGKAQALATLAKDASAAKNGAVSVAEAFENLTKYVETGNAKSLRSLHLFSEGLKDLVENQEKLTGKVFSENEKRQMRMDAVIAEGAKLRSAAAAGAGSTEAQARQLELSVDELKEALGKELVPLLKQFYGALIDGVKWLKDNIESVKKFGEAIAFVAGMITTYKLISLLTGISSAVYGIGAALALNPWTLFITMAVGAAAIVYKTWSDTQHQIETMAQKAQDAGVHKALIEGRLTWKQAQEQYGYKDEQYQDLLVGRTLTADEREKLKALSDDLTGRYKLTPKVTKGPDPDAVAAARKTQNEAKKNADEDLLAARAQVDSALHEAARTRLEDSMRIIESTKDQAEAQKAYAAVVKGTQEEFAAGAAKIFEEEKKRISDLSTVRNEKTGAVSHIQLAPETLAAEYRATNEKLLAYQLQFEAEKDSREQAMVKAADNRAKEAIEQIAAHFREIDDLTDDVYGLGLQSGKDAIDQRKSMELAQLEDMDAYTIQDKIALEQRKTAIETDALRRRTEIELREIDLRTTHELRAAEENGADKEAQDLIKAKGEAEKQALQAATGSEIDLAAVKQAAEAKKLVEDQYRSIFDTLKQEAGGVFDALLHKSTSVWQAIGNTFKNAMLTAIKEVVSSRVAAILTELVTGSKVSFARGGNGVLGGIMGGVPVFAGAAGIASAAGGGGGSILPGILGATGIAGGGGGVSAATPPFFPSSGGGYSGGSDNSGGGGAYSGGGSASGGGLDKMLMSGATKLGLGGLKGGFSGILGNLKSFVGLKEPGVAGSGAGGLDPSWTALPGFDPKTWTDKLQGIGHSNAAALAGGMLGLDGLKRGGYLGMAEDTAGGALLGEKFGGPIGAAIGASIGAAAGAIRLIWEDPVHEAKRLVKQIYGINIDTKMAQQIVDLAKQKYSSHVSIAVRDPDIRKMLELYAAGTGQKVPISAATPHAGSLVEQNGSLYQASTYLYGQAYNYQSNLPTIGGSPAGGQWPSGPMSLQINVGGQGAGQFVAGQVVTPDFVQAQWSAANGASNGRTQNSAMMQQPGLVVA